MFRILLIYVLALGQIFTGLAADPTPPGTATTKALDNTTERELLDIDQTLDQIIVPRIDFKNAPIKDIVQHLAVRSRLLDPKRKGINFILFGRTIEPSLISATTTSTLDDPFGSKSKRAIPEGNNDPFSQENPDLDPFAPKTPADTSIHRTKNIAPADPANPTITLQLNNTPLRVVIRYVALLAGLEWQVTPRAVNMYRPGTLVAPVETWTYAIPQTAWSAFRETVDPNHDDEISAKTMLARCGIPFPKGTRATYKARVENLIVTNTAKNLEQLSRTIHEIFSLPKQARIEATYLEILDPDYLADIHPARITADVFEKIPASKRRVISQLTGASVSGNSARIEADNRDNKSQEHLTFKPTVATDNRTIDLDLQWHRTDRAGRHFHTLKSRFIIYNGATIVIPIEEEGRSNSRYLMIKTIVTDTSGTPIPKRSNQ